VAPAGLGAELAYRFEGSQREGLGDPGVIHVESSALSDWAPSPREFLLACTKQPSTVIDLVPPSHTILQKFIRRDGGTAWKLGRAECDRSLRLTAFDSCPSNQVELQRDPFVQSLAALL
jgi:hypothetical protein